MFLACASLAGCAKQPLEQTSARLDVDTTPGVQVPAPKPASPLSGTVPISGAPATLAMAGEEYRFAPTVGATNEAISFSIVNQPAWASLDMVTGVLRGTPGTQDVGFYGPITIVATSTQGQGSFGPFTIEVRAAAPLPSPDLAATPSVPAPTAPVPGVEPGTPARQPGVGVGVAVLTWTAPLEFIDGRPLQDLAGYRVYQGDSPTSLRLSQELRDPGRITFSAENLPTGTHYFAVTAITSSGAESSFSNIGSKQIP